MKKNQFFQKINNKKKCRLFYINDNSSLTHIMQRYLHKCNYERAMQFTNTECHFLFQNNHNAGHRTVLEKTAVSVRPK
jgi:hypothetical protein